MSDNYNADDRHFTDPPTLFAHSVYTNYTDFEDFFTIAVEFTVKEIEVFKIADETALPADVKKGANGCWFREMAGNVFRGSAGKALSSGLSGRRGRQDRRYSGGRARRLAEVEGLSVAVSWT
jgi:hypothetical protein